jgi:pilus assembly protein CpaB
MYNRKITLIAGVIFALIAVFLINAYLNQQRRVYTQMAQRYAAEEKTSKPRRAVLIAKRDISKGTPIAENMLDAKFVPEEYLQPQAVDSFERISGMVAMTPISKGEQITLTKLSFPAALKESRRSLAMATPIGKRAISVSVEDIASVGGMIRAGDYVDVIATIPVPVQTAEGKTITQVTTVPLFQNVLVLAGAQQTPTIKKARYKKEREETKGKIVSTITLALTPQETNLLAFVQEQKSKIRLVLRSPADSKTTPVLPASWDTLFQYIMPQRMKQVKKQAQKPKETVRKVEIIRGLQKEEVVLTK